jgi:hypothetical protein
MLAASQPTEHRPVLTLDLADRAALVTAQMSNDIPTIVLTSDGWNPLGKARRQQRAEFLGKHVGLQDQMEHAYTSWSGFIADVRSEDAAEGNTNFPTAGEVVKAVNAFALSGRSEFSTLGGIRELSRQVDAAGEDYRSLEAFQDALSMPNMSEIRLLFVLNAFRTPEQN